MSRAAVTRSITQTKQAGTLAAPWGIRSHSLSPLGIKDLIGAGDRNRVKSVTLFYLFISYLTVVRMQPDFFEMHMRGLHHEHVKGWMRPAAM